MLVAPATAEWNDASAFILVTRAKKARREIPMADAEIDTVRDIWLPTEPSATADPRRNKAPVASTAAVRSTTRPGSPR